MKKFTSFYCLNRRSTKFKFVYIWILLPFIWYFIITVTGLQWSNDIHIIWISDIAITIFTFLTHFAIYQVIQERNKPNHLLSIAFYFFQYMPPILCLLVVGIDKSWTELNSIIIIILIFCESIASSFNFIRLYFIDKKLFMAILKWKNTNKILNSW